MVVPWISYSIWKFWVIHVLVFLVFQVFSTAELISLAKTVNLAVWAFSLIFLHYFTLFGIDMHQNRSISLFSTPFDHFHFHPLVALNCYPQLIPCLMQRLVALHSIHIRFFPEDGHKYQKNNNALAGTVVDHGITPFFRTISLGFFLRIFFTVLL